MKLLFLAGSGPHAHDYGLAYLFDGLVEVLGYDNVVDYPQNPTFHLSGPSARDDCGLDSDLFFTSRNLTAEQCFADVEAIVVGVPDVTAYRVCRHAKLQNKPVIAVDMSDQVADLRRIYESTVGRPLAAYLKRELPLDADWGHPFPMCYPAGRVPKPMPPKSCRVVYHATDHNGGAPGIPRRRIVAKLQAALSAEQLDVALYRGQEKGSRPSPEQLHEKMAAGLIGISWNGAVNWDCNRFSENFAFGLAQVAERPRIKIPNEPIGGQHCLYADTPDELADRVVELIHSPAAARAMATQGHEHFLKYHTSAARARQLIEILQRSA